MNAANLAAFNRHMKTIEDHLASLTWWERLKYDVGEWCLNFFNEYSYRLRRFYKKLLNYFT